MSGALTSGVNNDNIHVEVWMLTMNLASGIVAADVGKAVALDTAAANTVKLAGDGDQIFGRLETFEDRTTEGLKTGSVARQGSLVLPTVSSVPALGVYVIGGGSGQVKAMVAPADLTAAGQHRPCQVIARDATNRLVTVVLG